MIDCQYNELVYQCDGCDATLPTGETHWADAREEFKRQDWKAQKHGDTWEHFCPGCKV